MTKRKEHNAVFMFAALWLWAVAGLIGYYTGKGASQPTPLPPPTVCCLRVDDYTQRCEIQPEAL